MFMFIGFTVFSIGKSDENEQKTLQEKVDFILKVAKNVQLDANIKSKEFVIAIYGRGSDDRSLFKHWKHQQWEQPFNRNLLK